MKGGDMLCCDRCHKSLENTEGTEVIGIKVSMIFLGGNNQKPAHNDFLQYQLGKYELGKEYNFCYECLLDALFQTKGVES